MIEAKAREPLPYLTSTLWFLAGGVAGAGIALLLAPQSGRATRQRMARRVRRGADSARELRDRIVEHGEDVWDEAAQRVEDAASALAGSAERKPAERSEAAEA